MIGQSEIAYDTLLALLSLAVFVLCVILVIVCRTQAVESKGRLGATKPAPRMYPLTAIDAATDGFNPRRIIGEGRLGVVYAAELCSGGLVAVKRIHPRLVLSNAGLRFAAVLKTLSAAQHPNVVPILGYSQGPGERIVVMELVGLVSLDFYLHEKSGDAASLLDWPRRLRIAAGAARGLEHLHEGMTPGVVHGCVKSSNVLLDDKLSVKLCDYGLSFLAPRGEKFGTSGFVDDEHWAKGGGGCCKESDVYGFGVVLLEILTGRSCEGGLLVQWAIPLIKEMRFSELLDPRLVIPTELNPLVRLARVALACVGNSRKSRPSISQVAAILNSLEVGAGR